MCITPRLSLCDIMCERLSCVVVHCLQWYVCTISHIIHYMIWLILVIVIIAIAVINGYKRSIEDLIERVERLEEKVLPRD